MNFRGKPLPDRPSADRDHVSAAENRELAGELRDTERAIMLWHQKACGVGRLPSWTAFDLSPIQDDLGTALSSVPLGS
jgi:hypothetical protein